GPGGGDVVEEAPAGRPGGGQLLERRRQRQPLDLARQAEQALLRRRRPRRSDVGRAPRGTWALALRGVFAYALHPTYDHTRHAEPGEAFAPSRAARGPSGRGAKPSETPSFWASFRRRPDGASRVGSASVVEEGVAALAAPACRSSYS